MVAEDVCMPLLVQIPGLGVKLGLVVLVAIGDISRYPTHKHLVGFAGLGARVHDSDDMRGSGRIAKQGRPDSRYAMIQAAHNAVAHPRWHEEARNPFRSQQDNGGGDCAQTAGCSRHALTREIAVGPQNFMAVRPNPWDVPSNAHILDSRWLWIYDPDDPREER